MNTHESINENRCLWNKYWDRLCITLHLRWGTCESDFLVSAPLKTPQRHGSPPSNAHAAAWLPTETSAAAGNPEVKELRARLRAHGSLVGEFEAAAGRPITDVLLLRWITAKKGVANAEACLLQHFEWRIRLGPIREAHIQNELDAEKVFLQGCDAVGRSVVIVLAARHVIAARNLEETKKLITYTLETALAGADLAANPLGQILCLFDLSGLGLSNLDSKALLAVFEVLQQHFPESLSQLWFLNAPFIFWGLWRIVSPFIQPATRSKIRFLSSSQRAAQLKSTIPDKVLPRSYGGASEFIGIEQAALRLANETAPEATSTDNMAATAQTRRLAGLRRSTARMAGSTWAFVRDHNPMWAARTFVVGVRHAAGKVPKPGWKRPQMPRRAVSIAGTLHGAWQSRPSLPRPSYRLPAKLKPLSRPDPRSLCLVAVSVIGLAVLMIWQSVSEGMQVPTSIWSHFYSYS